MHVYNFLVHMIDSINPLWVVFRAFYSIPTICLFSLACIYIHNASNTANKIPEYAKLQYNGTNIQSLALREHQVLACAHATYVLRIMMQLEVGVDRARDTETADGWYS